MAQQLNYVIGNDEEQEPWWVGESEYVDSDLVYVILLGRRDRVGEGDHALTVI